VTTATPVYVVSVGACTAVGRDAWSSAAAVRGGIAGFSQHPYLVDAAGEPMRVARAGWMDIDTPAADRFSQLLTPSIDQALAVLDTRQSPPARLALALALPAARPGLPEQFESIVRERLSRQYSNRFSAIALFPHGHAAGLLALDAACRKLSDSSFDACIVAGVDSWIDADTLEWLEECDQLHGAGVMNNAWGFVPGEAAGAVLVAGEDATNRLAQAPLGRVLRVGVAVEANRIKTATVCVGQGLTEAFRSALSALPAGSRVTDVYCDMNGEPYRADEFGFTGVRVKQHFESLSDFAAPADCWGDVGAASGPLFLALAAIAGAKQYANGRLALAWASSEAGERAAALVELRGSA